MALVVNILHQIKNDSTNLNFRDKNLKDVEVKDVAEALKLDKFKNVTVLDLWNNKIGDTGVRYLAEALKSNKFITILHLGKNQIGAEGAKSLAEVLKNNHTITSLNLCGNQIGADGTKYLAEGLKNNHTITILNLCSNQIGAAGVKDLAKALKNHQSITNLNLNFNQIGDSGLKHLAEALRTNESITYLDLHVNQIGDAGVNDLIEALKVNHYITALNLNNKGNFETLNDSLLYVEEVISIFSPHLALRLNHKNRTYDTEGNVKVDIEGYAVTHPDCNVIGQDREKWLTKALQINKDSNEKVKKRELKKMLGEEEKTKVEICIPRVHIFDVPDRDDQINYHHQATIRYLSELIRDGNDRLQHRSKKGVLLLGNTGAGKSTLAYLFAKRKLQAIFNDQCGKLIIDAMNPLKDIVIGHQMNSETKIPNKCFIEDEGITVWDCPGYNDTDLVQVIANSFYIKRIIETTEQLKFVLVIVESDLDSNKGNNFLDTLSNFLKGFENIESIEESISLVITRVPNGTRIQHIGTFIENIVRDNHRAEDRHRNLVNKLKNSIHMFHRPEKEGELDVNSIFAQINFSSKYSAVKSNMVKISISKEAKEFSFHLLNVIYSNFNKLLDVIISAITDSTQCLYINEQNVFYGNCALITDWIPSSICYNALQRHKKDEYFLELDFLSKLQGVLNSNQILSISDAIIVLRRAIEVFAEYAEPDNVQFQKMIQGYGYCLQQQYDYVIFFASVCETGLPDHQQIAELITACHLKTTDILKCQVISLYIAEDKLDTDYYNKAIKYLEPFQDSSVCMNLKAIAYSCLGSITEQNNKSEAIIYYAKAIDANRHLPEVYEKLGKLLFKNNQYSKAIDCYKVINNAFKIEECFNEWLKQDKENSDVMLKQAEYFESIGLFEKSIHYYYYAIGFSQNKNFKKVALEKVGKIMIDTAATTTAKGQATITRAQNQDFYNFDLVDKEFIEFFLSGINIK